MTLQFTQETNADVTTIKAIEEGLVAYNTLMAGYPNAQPLLLAGRDEAGAIKAGLKGRSVFRWLFVEWLWVAEEFRKQDYGSYLLSETERIAKERGCIGVYLDTYSFQAPKFYARHGYKEFGRVDHFPPGHARIFFAKHFEG